MTDDSIHPLGPLFGPDFITIEIEFTIVTSPYSLMTHNNQINQRN
jgi:hypothetical protein